MFNPIIFVTFCFFIMILFFDIKTKTVPSILGTSLILVLAVVNSKGIPYGVIGLLFAILLYESGMYKGMADVKMIIAIGFLLNSIVSIYSFMIVLTLYTLIYNILMVMVLKKEEYAGTVPIFYSFIILWISGNLI